MIRGRSVVFGLSGMALTVASLLSASTVHATPSPGTVTVGVGGAAPSSVPFSGGPITGTADASGSSAPTSCSDPTCETIAISLAAPPAQPPNEISLTAAITFTAPAGNPQGLTGLDLWLLDSKGNVIGSATSGSSPASVSTAGQSDGATFTLEISGEAAANNDTYSGTVSASVPSVTPPAPPGSLFNTGVLPFAPSSGLSAGQTNEDAEPGIGVAGDGTIWVASDIAPFAAHDQRALSLLSGTDIWKSSDGGNTWQWVAAPFNNASSSQAGAGGEDTDIAVAPNKNSNGFYNIYAASLWVGSTNVAISEDGGNTWNVTSVNGEPVQDRPWLSADGPCIFYLSYHALAPYDTIVDKYDACNASGQAVGSAVNPTVAQVFLGNIAPGLSNRFGKQVVDTSPTSPHQHRIYVPMEGCSTPTQNGLPEVGEGCQTTPDIFIGYADPGSGSTLTFTNVTVAPVPTKKLFIWPDTIATDAAGNVYIAWFDDQHSYVQRSSDGGNTWSTRVQVNASPALSSVYPTVAAAGAGRVEVAFYGSTRAGDADNASVMGPPNLYGSAKWQLFWRSSDDGGKTWRKQETVTPTIHTGVLCYNGSGCGAYAGDRNLLDDFGLAISPTTGLAAITFSNDQPDGLNSLTHTDFAAQQGPGTNIPELLNPGVGLLGAGLLAGWVIVRRRRAKGASP